MAIPPLIDANAPRFFLDSSVILAGVSSQGGASHALLVLAEIGMLRLLVIDYIFNEVERNLTKKLMRAIPRYHQIQNSIAWEISADPPLSEVEKWMQVVPAKDAPVLAAAVLAKPARLITLDTRHFLAPEDDVARRSGLNIQTPGQVLRDVRSVLARGFM